MADNNTIDRELSWDDEIFNDSEFVLIPEGDYAFTVKGFERGRYEGSDKLPPCNKAIITIGIHMPDGSTADIKHNLYLHGKCEGLLSAFFVGIGQKKKGEPLRMNWNAVIGATGRCKVSIRKWKNKDGEEMQSNDIKKFYEPTAPAAPQNYAQPAQPIQPIQPAQTYTQPAQTAPAYNPAPAQGGVYMPGKF